MKLFLAFAMSILLLLHFAGELKARLDSALGAATVASAAGVGR